MTKTETAIPVHIVFVLDRSGSMQSIKTDVIGGFNAFVEEQKAQPGKCRLTLIQFDDRDPHEIKLDAVKIADVSVMTDGDFVPRGNTPLLDAEGWTIAHGLERAKLRAEAGKAEEAVLFVTFTDGYENASREWSLDRLVKAKAEREAAGWSFTYLGVGHDAYGQARSVGTHAAATRSAAATADGVNRSMRSANYASSNVRSKALRGSKVESANLYEGMEEPATTS